MTLPPVVRVTYTTVLEVVVSALFKKSGKSKAKANESNERKYRKFMVFWCPKRRVFVSTSEKKRWC